MDWWGIVAQKVLNKDQQLKLAALQMYTALMDRSRTTRLITNKQGFNGDFSFYISDVFKIIENNEKIVLASNFLLAICPENASGKPFKKI